MKIFVETYNLVEGFHKWENAPDSCAYLRAEHRHLFEIRCRFEVAETDREIEINIMQNNIAGYLHVNFGNPCHFGGMSCEMIAEKLLLHFGLMQCCTVLEDGYGGATLTR